MRRHDKATRATVTPATALAYLRDGNDRFLGNLAAHRDLLEQGNETRDGQFPFAAILSCIDSRTSAEPIFDQGLGDIFDIRFAGNVVAPDVLDHTKCGAIMGARDGVRLGNPSTVLALIQPAIELERTVSEGRDATNTEFVDKMTRIQIERGVERVIEGSPVPREMVAREEIGVIGALSDIDSGKVAFLEETFLLGEATPIDRSKRLVRSGATARG